MSAPYQLVLGEQGTVAECDTLADAVTEWGRVLEREPFADLLIVRQGEILADINKHDTCTVHDIFFSKEINCPSCDAEEDDPYAAEKASRRKAYDGIAGLLARDDANLTQDERDQLQSALFHLED